MPAARRTQASHARAARRRAQPAAIQSVAQGRSKRKTLMIFGDSGVGKTVLAGTSPGRTLLLRPPTDHTDSIANEGVKEWVVNDWSEMDDVLLYLRTEGASEWDWVWLDSISLMQDQTLDDLWETVIREKPARARYGLDKQEYGINMMRLARWVRHMVGSPGNWNFGITAFPQSLAIAEHDEAETKLMPWIQGKMMSPRICGYTNLVGYLEVLSKGTRRLHIEQGEKYYAKNQFRPAEAPITVSRIDNPTMPKLLSVIEGYTQTTRRPTRGARRTSSRKGS